jgi:hypothetical protein
VEGCSLLVELDAEVNSGKWNGESIGQRWSAAQGSVFMLGARDEKSYVLGRSVGDTDGRVGCWAGPVGCTGAEPGAADGAFAYPAAITDKTAAIANTTSADFDFSTF